MLPHPVRGRVGGYAGAVKPPLATNGPLRRSRPSFRTWTVLGLISLLIGVPVTGILGVIVPATRYATDFDAYNPAAKLLSSNDQWATKEVRRGIACVRRPTVSLQDVNYGASVFNEPFIRGESEDWLLGFPLPCAFRRTSADLRYGKYVNQDDALYMRAFGKPWIIPTRWAVLPLMVNGLLPAAPIFLAFVALRWARAASRTRRRLCASCGHPLFSDGQCKECGFRAIR